MFNRPDRIPQRFGAISFPEQVKSQIQAQNYSNAAEFMISRTSIPFNVAVTFLSGCPEALARYLYGNIPEMENMDMETVTATEEGNDASFFQDDNDELDDESEDDDDPDKQMEKMQKRRQKDQQKKAHEDEARKKMTFSARSCVLINMCLAVSIPLVMNKREKRERKEGIEKLRKFCAHCKSVIEKNHVYEICREVGDDFLLQEIYSVFNDHFEYCMLMFEQGKTKNIINILKKLPPQQCAEVYMKFTIEQQIELVGELRKNSPDAEAFLPLIAKTLGRIGLTNRALIREDKHVKGEAKSGSNEKAMSKEEILMLSLCVILQNMYSRMLMKTPAQRQMVYHFVSHVAKSRADFRTLFAGSDFSRIGYDFILRHLERTDRCDLASYLCAHIADRHPLAVTYANLEGMDELTILLNEELTNASDLRECWIRALERSRPKNKAMYVQSENPKVITLPVITEDAKEKDPYEKSWENLLKKAPNSKVVTMDDIFPMMPIDMEIAPFQDSIRSSLIRYKGSSDESLTMINKLTLRSDEQRAIIQKGASMVVELDPTQSCRICKSSIYKEPYLVFPCEHTVHIKCLMSNMHLYYDATTQLNLISMSAKAGHDEKKAADFGELIGESCPFCGKLSLTVLSKDFIQKGEKGERKQWELPSATDDPNATGENEHTTSTKILKGKRIIRLHGRYDEEAEQIK